MTDKSPESPSLEAVSSVVSFYGSELASHAGIMVGFVVALFALFQAHDTFIRRGSPLALLNFVAFLIIWGGVYSSLRIVYYGSLAGALMNCSVDSWRAFVRNQQINRLPHAEVAVFATLLLKNDTRFHGLRKEMYRVQSMVLISFVIAGVFAVVMLAWGIVVRLALLL